MARLGSLPLSKQSPARRHELRGWRGLIRTYLCPDREGRLLCGREWILKKLGCLRKEKEKPSAMSATKREGKGWKPQREPLSRQLQRTHLSALYKPSLAALCSRGPRSGTLFGSTHRSHQRGRVVLRKDCFSHWESTSSGEKCPRQGPGIMSCERPSGWRTWGNPPGLLELSFSFREVEAGSSSATFTSYKMFNLSHLG